MEHTVPLLSHQLHFALDTHRYTALVGGFGCGKSYAIGAKLFALADANRGYPGMLITRSGGQLYNLQVEVEKVLQAHGLTYIDWNTYRRSTDAMTFTLFDGRIYRIRWSPGVESEVFCHTAENRAYTRWAGGNRAFAILDEIDTMQDPADVWRFANDRVRIGPFNQTACASTPEGYGFLWDFFENQPLNDPTKRDDRTIIRGCTFENPHINLDYVSNQIDTRDPASLRAYIYGEFVNLEGALVYYKFDKTQNITSKKLSDFGMNFICHVGVDFNKGINAASVTIIDNGNLYTVHEFQGANNIDILIADMFKVLRGRHIRIYPDASGFEGIQQLERAFGESAVIYNPANPDIKMSVTAVNQKLMSPTGVPTWYVNPQTCPNVFATFMRQTKDAKGLPDKTQGLDHMGDNIRYMCWQLFPIGMGTNTATVYDGR